MTKLGTVESTLFVPMLGRIYASENFPKILYDKRALDLKEKLPRDIVQDDTQNQYTYLASASRSANVDRYVKDFLELNPSGAIVQLGCGLETTFNRNDDGKSKWYSIDLPDVIEYRRTLLPESPRESYLSDDAFSDAWIKKVREELGKIPLLVIASGLFYYFEEEKVLSLMRTMHSYGNIELVFDTVNRKGMRMMQKKWMKKVGHEDAKMFFYVDSADELASKIGRSVNVIAEESYYKYINKEGLKIVTKISMRVSDLMNMVKMIHLKL